jgi:hypothetical protein
LLEHSSWLAGFGWGEIGKYLKSNALVQHTQHLVTLFLASIKGPPFLDEESNSADDPDEKPEHCRFDIFYI